ncbi:MAG: 3-phosphoshikimate 1-carboxyvinyltransferase [Planctomycetes bacterium]|nr:3-phosphoshikimate 1-carboxyvinyltransferase [Planctomycetota bacterium]
MSAYHCRPVGRPLDAVVTPPGSKSMTNRALIAAALADGHSLLTGVLIADDTRLMFDALRALGIPITVDETGCVAEVTGCRGRLPADEADLFCGNAGTVMRFCTALTATAQGRFRLDGVERMRQRPIGGLVTALRALGTGIEYLETDGYPPIVVHAEGLRGGRLTLASPESSQMISALLLAAPLANGDVMIEVTGDVPSVPYLKLTTAVMDQFGVTVVEQYDASGAKFIIEAPQRYRAQTLAIEPDASSATYFLAAPAIAGGRVTVEGLGTQSLQGDVGFVDVLEQMGCRVERHSQQLTVIGPQRGERLHGVDVDLSAMPDTVPTLAVVALFADSPTVIRNVANLRVKECDRLTALRCELSKLGAVVEELPDGLRIVPPSQPCAAQIDTYNDHRIAMSFALAGLRCEGLVIHNPQCCEKTFPDFFQRFEAMSAL